MANQVFVNTVGDRYAAYFSQYMKLPGAVRGTDDPTQAGRRDGAAYGSCVAAADGRGGSSGGAGGVEERLDSRNKWYGYE